MVVPLCPRCHFHHGSGGGGVSLQHPCPPCHGSGGGSGTVVHVLLSPSWWWVGVLLQCPRPHPCCHGGGSSIEHTVVLVVAMPCHCCHCSGRHHRVTLVLTAVIEVVGMLLQSLHPHHHCHRSLSWHVVVSPSLLLWVWHGEWRACEQVGGCMNRCSEQPGWHK